jgi:hypothetical protein
MEICNNQQLSKEGLLSEKKRVVTMWNIWDGGYNIILRLSVEWNKLWMRNGPASGGNRALGHGFKVRARNNQWRGVTSDSCSGI